MIKIYRELNTKKVLFFTTLALCIGILSFWYFSKPAIASWFDDNWAYRKAIPITNNTSAENNVYIEVTIDTSDTTKFQTDCGDLRFTNYNGDLQPYYVISGCSSASTVIRIELNTFPAGAQTIYYYYGNPSAANGFKNLSASTTATYYSGAGDGHVSIRGDVGDTWDGNHDATAGEGSAGYTGTTIWALSGAKDVVGDFWRGFIPIDSSALPDNAVISAATLNLFENYHNNQDDDGEDFIVVIQTTQASTSELVLEDFDQAGAIDNPTEGSDRIDIGDITSASYNTFTLNATGLGWVKKTAADPVTMLGIREGHDVLDSPYVGSSNTWNQVRFNSSESDGTAHDPYLSVTYATSDFTTEASNYTVGSIGSEEKGPGPKLYWQFDEGTGTNAEDSTSNNLDGTLNNTPTWQAEDMCLFGKCLYFDGTNNENVSLADDSKLDFGATGNFTVTAWVKRNGASSAINYIVTKHDVTDDTEDGGYKLYMDDSGDLCFGIDDDITWDPDVSACTSAVEFDDDQWHYVTGVRDQTGTDTVILYVDGKQRASTADSTTATLANSNIFYVGVDRDVTSNEWLGFIDEVKVYPYARSAAQIKTDFASRGSIKGVSAQMGGADQNYLSNGLVGYWKMDDSGVDAEGETSTDSSGNGNNGTLYGDNGVGDNNTGMTCTDGAKFGTGCTFDGTDDYIDIADNATLDIPEDLTVSLWVNPGSTQQANTDILTKDRNYRFEMDDTANSNIYFFGWRPVGQQYTCYTNGFTLTANTWQHLTAVKKGSTRYIYINGVDANATCTGSGATIDTDNSTLDIGGYSADTARAWNGKADEVRLYNRALSPKEVSDLYNFAPGPLLYYNLDEKSGSNVYDTGTGGNSTTVSGGSWINGKQGGGLYFNGPTRTFSAGTPTNLNDLPVKGDFTVEAWVKPEGVYSGDSFGYIAMKNPSGDGGWGLYTGSCAAARIDFFVRYDTSSDAQATTSSGSAPCYTWNHIAAVYKKSLNTIAIYINGREPSYQLAPTTGSGNIATDASTALTFSYVGTNRLVGTLDEIKIYNYARTGAQIAADYGTGLAQTKPVSYWKFDEGALNRCSGGTNDFCDSTLNVNDLAFSTTSGGYTDSGKFGKAFNGTGAVWASRSNDADLDFSATDDFAISGWFKSDSATNPSNGTEYIVSTTTGNTDAGYSIYANTDGTICFGIDDDTTWGPDVSSCTTADYYDGNWHHITAVRNVTLDKTYIYIDALVKDSDTDTTTATLDGNNVFYLGDFDGDNNGTAGTEEFAGDIDEVKVYRYALTADEVKTEYNRGSSMVLGALGNNSTYASNASNQEYCVPGDTTSCTAPVGEWKFEEKTGIYAYDTSGNGNTGTLNNNPLWTTGKFGTGLDFGSSTWIDAGSGSNLDDLHANAFTAEAWIKADSWGDTCNGTACGFIISKAASDDGWRFFVDSNNGAGLNGRVDCATTNANSSSGTDEFSIDGKWHHVAMTYDNVGDRKVHIWIDGKEVSSYPQQITCVDAYAPEADPLVIGNNGTGDDVYNFDGKIDDIRIFNYARTPAQIAWDYNKGAPIGYWDFDECQGSTVGDLSGNGNTGTITIGASGENTLGTCTTSSTAWGSGATGKRNASLSFDGTDDYVTVTQNSIINTIGDDFSVSFWLNSTQTSPGGLFPALISKDAAGCGGGVYDWFIDLNDVNSGGVGYIRYFEGDGCAQLKTTRTVNDGAWHHIVFTRVKSTGLDSMYLDGALNNTMTGTTSSLTNSQNLYFGVLDTTSGYGYAGQLDDVRLYNYTLTATQVKNLYNNGAVNFAPATGSP